MRNKLKNLLAVGVVAVVTVYISPRKLITALSLATPAIVAGIGTYFGGPILAGLLGSGTPTTWYAAIMVTMPTDDSGTGAVEATWTGYARQPITNNNTNFPAPSIVAGFYISTGQLGLSWGVVSGLGGGGITVNGIALYDSLTGGNLGPLMYFASGQPIVNGNVPTISAGAYQLQIQ